MGRDTLREDLPWPVLLPWISSADGDGAGAGLAAGWWRSCPRMVADAHGFGQVAAGVAGLIVEKHPEIPLGRLLARLPTERWVDEPGLLTVRARGVCSRMGISQISDVGPFSVGELQRCRGGGLVTAREIVTVVLDTVIRGPLGTTSADTGVLGAADTTRPDTSLDGSDAGKRSIPQQQPATVEVSSRSRASAQHRRRVPRSSKKPVDIVGEQQRFFSSLVQRDVAIAKQRIFATIPDTLAVVASAQGISAPRVGQIVQRLHRRWRERFDSATATGGLIEQILSEFDPVAHISTVIRRLPLLARVVPVIEVPLWRVLAVMHPELGVDGEWITASGVELAVGRTGEIVTSHTGATGNAPLGAVAEALNLPSDDAADWLRICGLYVDGDIVHAPPVQPAVLTPGRHRARWLLKDRIARFLIQSGTPMSIDELLKCLDPGTARRGVEGALRRNAEFVRVGVDMWGLASWNVHNYASLCELIAGKLDDAGGCAPIEVVVGSVIERYPKAEECVRSWAALPPFRTEDGTVSYRDAGVPLRGRRQRRCLRLYRAGTGWCHAVTVTDKLLGGSSFPITVDLAEVAGCRRGASVALDSRHGSRLVRWSGELPHCSSIRSFLRDLDAAAGDLVFLQFLPDGTFDVSRADPAWRSGPPLEKVLASIGASTQHASDRQLALQTIATACDLPPGAGLAETLDQLQRRGGTELRCLLKEATAHR